MWAYPDAGLRGGAQPVSVGGEAQGMNDITSIQAVQPLALSQIPQHGNTILHNTNFAWLSKSSIPSRAQTNETHDPAAGNLR